MTALVRLRTIGTALLVAMLMIAGCADSNSLDEADLIPDGNDGDDGEVESTCVWDESHWDDCSWD